uniref:Uncharacterized protein n=1 Tax=Amphimedon queenslandica TaxID=400682 RepID=A0A1X7TYZ0_AMPQE
WFTSEFLPYLKEWEEYVKSCTNKTARERKRMCIARETIKGLRITGKSTICYCKFTSFIIHSFVELVEYIFSNIEGVKVFFSERLTQDPIEAFFGRQRMRGAAKANPLIGNAVALLSRIHPETKWLQRLLQPCYTGKTSSYAYQTL